MTAMIKGTDSYRRARARTATNTFTIEEVRGVLELLALARRGGDVRTVMRSEVMRRTERKFLRMREDVEARAAQVDAAPTSPEE